MLEVTDDGRGTTGAEGSGLAGMRERISAVGGEVVVASAGRAWATRHRLGHGAPHTPDGLARPGGHTMSITVLLAEDQRIVLGALARCSALEPDLDVVGRARRRRGAAPRPDAAAGRAAHRHRDARPTGLDVAAEIRTARTGHAGRDRHHLLPRGYLRRALDAGCGGYLLKDAPVEKLVEAVRAVHAGRRAIDPELAADAWSEPDPLTERERQVVRLAGEGLATPRSRIASTSRKGRSATTSPRRWASSAPPTASRPPGSPASEAGYDAPPATPTPWG